MRQPVNRRIALFCLLVAAFWPASPAHAADPQLVINELMYHSFEAWPTNQPYPTSNRTEFVELYNAGPTLLTLTNYQFNTGITFAFTGGTIAPSNYIVLCENVVAFTNAYPTVTNLVGQYSGSLANGAERVTLSRFVNGKWVTEDTIHYIDDNDSDGSGRSLELVHPSFARLDNQYFGDWAASSTLGGTPGRINSRFAAAPLPVAGDVLHDPPLPPAGSSVKVTVRATGRNGNALGVVLQYRKDANPTNVWAFTNMVDHGGEGDLIPGDGIYTAFLPPPTNGPNPALVMGNGEMAEFLIKVTDGIGTRTFPATNRTGTVWSNVVSFSYLCKFGEDDHSDEAYPGEYPTYHILMTAVNRAGLEAPGNLSNDMPRDATIILPDRTIEYNSNARLRGSGSRTSDRGGYQLELPTGHLFEGDDEINLNHENALAAFMGMDICRRAGLIASDVELSRVFLNNVKKNAAHHFVYTRVEAVNSDFVRNHFPPSDFIGNVYFTTGSDAPEPSFQGDLTTLANVGLYDSHYGIRTNYPYRTWFDLHQLTTVLTNVVNGTIPSLSNSVDVANWGRLYAALACIDNSEAGFYSTSGYGDEMRLYIAPNGVAHLFPWDLSDSLDFPPESDGLTPNIWAFTFSVIDSFLYSRPILPYYTGELIEIITNTMSDANMNDMFDRMGSKVDASLRERTLDAVFTNRITIKSQINEALTVNGLATGAPVLLVPSAGASLQLNLAGTAPQNYTDRVLVNGNSASWTPRFPTWSMTNTVTIPGDVADVLIKTLHPNGSVLKTLAFKAVGQRTPVTVSANITTDTIWAPASGIYVITNNISVAAGAKLTIQPQTVVLFSAGRTLTVNGRLDVLGSSSAPVQLLPQGGTTPWLITGSGTNATLVVSNAVCTLGRISAVNGATLRIYDSTLSGSQDTNGIVQSSAAGSVLLSRSIVRDFNRTRFDTSPTTIDQCLFENMSAVGIEFSGTASTATVRRTTLRNPLGTDGITFANATAGLVTNVLIEGMSGTGLAVRASAVTVVNNLLDACGTGLHVGGASSVVARNNSLVNCGVGVNGTPGLTNAIIWSSATLSVTNGPATATRSDIQLPGNSIYSGTGNLNRDPFFRSTADRDYQLLAVSPCLTAGVGGVAMGAAYPTGANPVAPTNLSLAATSNSVQLAWTDLSADETGFQALRSTDGGENWTLVATAPAGATEHTDGGLTQNTTYAYRLRAIHPRGASAYTDIETITTSVQGMTQLLTNYLRITEVMYHPSETADPNELTEFLEFKNISSDALLDLTGLYTDNGNDGPPYRYSFTNGTTLGPQEFFVLARNAAGFAARYPGVTINDTFDDDDRLNNGSEDIWVRNASGKDLIRFDYADGFSGRSWYATTDGAGYSLVPNNPNPATENMDDDLSWRASGAIGGSPGQDDPNPIASGIVISEVLAHTDFPYEDAVELSNIGTNAVNVAGWYLSDDAGNLRKYRIPPTPNRILQPGTFGVLYAGQTFDSAGASVPFNVTETGQEPVILSASVGTNLTGYRSTVTFRGAIANMYANPTSFGRYTRSDGRVDFVALQRRTFGVDNPADLTQFRSGSGTNNTGPKVGPVVISEIMYNPGPGGNEFIEMLNITNVSVRLFFDINSMPGVPASAGTNVWQLRDAISYRFPTNTWMNPGERILVTGIAPAEFRTKFAIPQNIRIFGPFTGDLNNSADSVELVMPGDPEPNQTVFGIMVDRVAYQDNLPWPPEADNDGASLERLNTSAYGDDPANWVGVTVGGTPGAINNTTSVPSVGFSDVSDRSLESNTTIQVEVRLHPSVTSTVTVSYVVSGGTATAGSDYTLASGSLTFWPYETLKTIPLVILDDITPAGELDESVEITLTNLSANALLGGNLLYTHTIVDNDATNLAAPVILPNKTTDFIDSINVEILPTVAYSEIRYTLDGTVPDEDDIFYDGPFTVDSSARITARTFLGSYNAGNWTSVLVRAQAIPPGWIPPPPLPPGAMEVSVRGSLDDGYQPNSIVAVRTTDLTIGMLAGTSERAFFRFFGATIPAGANVTNAYIQFTAATNSSGTANITIRGEARDNALPLSPTTTNISSRLTTTNVTTWSPPAWTVSERGTAQRTPNLVSIVREITARPGWNTTNALAFIMQVPSATTASRVHAFDGSSLQAATLHVEWTMHYFAALTNGPGTIAGGNLLVFPGSFASATATPQPGYVFAGWSGDVGAADTNANLLTVLMDRSRTATANFILIPTPSDEPRFVDLSFASTSNFTVRWQSSTDFVYTVYRSTNLMHDRPGETLASGLPGHPSGTNAFTDTTATNAPAFYSIQGIGP